jgi:hypothetical protein
VFDFAPCGARFFFGLSIADCLARRRGRFSERVENRARHLFWVFSSLLSQYKKVFAAAYDKYLVDRLTPAAKKLLS